MILPCTALNVIEKACENASDNFALSIIAQLTGRHGSPRFDRVSNSKTVQVCASTLVFSSIVYFQLSAIECRSHLDC